MCNYKCNIQSTPSTRRLKNDNEYLTIAHQKGGRNVSQFTGDGSAGKGWEGAGREPAGDGPAGEKGARRRRAIACSGEEEAKAAHDGRGRERGAAGPVGRVVVVFTDGHGHDRSSRCGCEITCSTVGLGQRKQAYKRARLLLGTPRPRPRRLQQPPTKSEERATAASDSHATAATT